MAPRGVRRGTPSSLLVEELDRLLGDVLGSVDEVLKLALPTPESLHRLHRDLRRLAAGLAIWQELLARRDRELLRPLDARLRRLSQLVGRVRDRDIAIGLLERGDGSTSTPRERQSLERYRARLGDDARTGRELLRAFLRAERDAHLFDRVQESFHVRPPDRRAADLPRMLARSHTKSRERLDRAHRRARRRPSSARLHRLRIRVRGVRHLSEISTKILPRSTPPFPAFLRRLQSDLGRLHDLDVVLDGLDREIRSTAWADALRKKRRRQRRRIVDRLDEGPLLPHPARSRASRPGRQAHRDLGS